MIRISFNYTSNININNKKLNYYVNLLFTKELASKNKFKIDKEKKNYK